MASQVHPGSLESPEQLAVEKLSEILDEALSEITEPKLVATRLAVEACAVEISSAVAVRVVLEDEQAWSKIRVHMAMKCFIGPFEYESHFSRL